ncbi:MAG: hypothetical protein GC129_00505 [Proteobacteria bacterium]|nr:hypothetical protein [Pseudomonadota bacterium]
MKLVTRRWRLTDSLLVGLLLRLTVVLLLVLAGVVWMVGRTLDQAGDRAQDELLRRQAAELMANMTVGKNDRVKLDLPPSVADSYTLREDGYVYVVHDGHGNILAQSDQMAPLWVSPALAYTPEGTLTMNTRDRDGDVQALYLLVQPVHGVKRTLYVVVGQYRTIDDVLLDSAKSALMRDMVLLLGPLFLLAMVGGVGLLQQGLMPLRALSREVAQMGGRMKSGEDVRLSMDNVPSEVRPLVFAFNDVVGEMGKLLAAQKALTADTAHQLKTPLAVLQARLEQLGNFKGKAEVERDVRRMDRMVRQLLHYAVLSQHPAALREADLVPVVRDVVMGLVPLARQNGIDLGFDAPGKAVVVEMDAIQVGEAVQNLIDNAIRHSPKKKSVDVEVTKDGCVRVADRGPGIAANEQALVFTRFWQGPDGESQHGGAGLGLAVVAEIMRQHGGTARVESREGGGSVFELGFRVV